jgi:hypothetical protein
VTNETCLAVDDRVITGRLEAFHGILPFTFHFSPSRFRLRDLCVSVVKFSFLFSLILVGSRASVVTAFEPGMECHHRQDDSSDKNIVG